MSILIVDKNEDFLLGNLKGLFQHSFTAYHHTPWQPSSCL